jgi:hypothetical protein
MAATQKLTKCQAKNALHFVSFCYHPFGYAPPLLQNLAGLGFCPTARLFVPID